MNKRVTVTHESPSGRNTNFRDNRTGSNMTRAQFVNQINNGNYEKYYVRDINGVATPVSKPDASLSNNLDRN
jgi:hypothetical protein